MKTVTFKELKNIILENFVSEINNLSIDDVANRVLADYVFLNKQKILGYQTVIDKTYENGIITFTLKSDRPEDLINDFTFPFFKDRLKTHYNIENNKVDLEKIDETDGIKTYQIKVNLK